MLSGLITLSNNDSKKCHGIFIYVKFIGYTQWISCTGKQYAGSETYLNLGFKVEEEGKMLFMLF